MKNTDDFLQAMQDVQPIKAAKRVLLSGRNEDKKATDQQTIAVRQQAAQFSQTVTADPLVNADVDVLDANAVLAFQRPGVQHGVYRQLRMGKYTIEARLDLHKMSVEQARVLVFQFVKDCLSHDVRCALVTHGKGEGRSTPAVLKSHVAHWLPQIGEVLAFHSAQKHHGGTGATYVMLKKSDKQRSETLERHQRR